MSFILSFPQTQIHFTDSLQANTSGLFRANRLKQKVINLCGHIRLLVRAVAICDTMQNDEGVPWRKFMKQYSVWQWPNRLTCLLTQNKQMQKDIKRGMNNLVQQADSLRQKLDYAFR